MENNALYINKETISLPSYYQNHPKQQDTPNEKATWGQISMNKGDETNYSYSNPLDSLIDQHIGIPPSSTVSPLVMSLHLWLNVTSLDGTWSVTPIAYRPKLYRFALVLLRINLKPEILPFVCSSWYQCDNLVESHALILFSFLTKYHS